jgi:hypothetical protein
MLLRIRPMLQLDTGYTGVQDLEDRREKIRFPIPESVSYKLTRGRGAAGTGLGRTINMSSAGLLFTTEQPLPLGVDVEVSVHWPVLLNSGCALKFVVFGSVVRSENHQAAVRITRYEFRTRAIRPE